MQIHEFGASEADIVLIQPVDVRELPGMEQELAVIRENVKEDFRMIALCVEDWNCDLSPWPAPPVFGSEGFSGGAERTLAEVLKLCKDKEKRCYLGGYSLAGLFALWAGCQSDAFAGIAAASPSVWYPGFVEYLKLNEFHSDSVYLSLGDREEKTRNPVMGTVGARIRETHELLKERGIRCTLEWNPGGHFKDAELRTAKAFSRVIEMQREIPK